SVRFEVCDNSKVFQGKQTMGFLERSKSVKGTLDTVLEGETTESHKNVLSRLDQQVFYGSYAVYGYSDNKKGEDNAHRKRRQSFGTARQDGKLSKCTSHPLSNWGLDIATALRLIATTKPHISWDQLSSLGEGYVIDAIPSYHGSVSPALNELCLGLKPEEVAHALSDVYAKDVHVRMARLNTAKCIPPISTHSVPQEVDIATSI
ncbi:hypothetical protein Tco_0931359, partial [Tanacetum coccineum]